MGDLFFICEPLSCGPLSQCPFPLSFHTLQVLFYDFMMWLVGGRLITVIDEADSPILQITSPDKELIINITS